VCQQVRQLPRLGFELRHARAASLRSLLAAGLLPASLLAVSLLAASLLVWRPAFHGSGVAGDATAGPRIRVALRPGAARKPCTQQPDDEDKRPQGAGRARPPASAESSMSHRVG